MAQNPWSKYAVRPVIQIDGNLACKIVGMALLAFFGLSVAVSEAAQIFYNSTKQALIISGPLVEGDFQSFEAELAKTEGKRGYPSIILDSEGGQVEPAFQIMDVVRRKSLQTIIPKNGICFSACAYIFMNGEKPKMHYSAQLGFHATWLKLSDQEPASGLDIKDAFRSGQQDIKRLLATKKIPIDLILEFLDKRPDELFLIDTVHKARTLDISVFGLFDPQSYPWEYRDENFSGVAPSETSAFWAIMSLEGEEESLVPENMALVEVTNFKELSRAIGNLNKDKNGSKGWLGEWAKITTLSELVKLFKVVQKSIKRGQADAISFEVFGNDPILGYEKISDVQFSENGELIIYKMNDKGIFEPKWLRALEALPPGLKLNLIPQYQLETYRAPLP